MTDPTALEIAAALRSAAEFCRDPDSSKVHFQPARSADGRGVPPCSPEATGWCALGYAAKALGLGHETGDMIYATFHKVGVDVDTIWPVFDDERYEEAANVLECAAAVIEDTIPTTTPARIPVPA